MHIGQFTWQAGRVITGKIMRETTEAMKETRLNPAGAVLLLLLSFWPASGLQAQGIDINVPILPPEFWERYDSEAEALAKGESSSAGEQQKAAVTLFLLSRDEDNEKKSLELVKRASDIINRIYRRNRNDLSLALLSGEISMGVADKSSKLQDKINYTNRGLANYEFSLPNIPENLEAKQIYLRTTVYVPSYFKKLGKEQLQQVRMFLDNYDAAMAQLQSPTERKRLEEFKTHVMILAAEISNRKSKTRGDVAGYLSQVDTSFFETMKANSNGDLVEMYYKLTK